MQLNTVAYRMNFKTQSEAIVFIEKKINNNLAKKNYSKINFRCHISKSVFLYKVEFAATESFHVLVGTLIQKKNCRLTSLACFKIKLEKKNLPVQTEFTTSAESQRLLHDVQKPVLEKKIRLVEEFNPIKKPKKIIFVGNEQKPTKYSFVTQVTS